MAKKKKKNEEVTNADLFKSIRKNWNGINPVSRIVESKKKKPPKHKHKIYGIIIIENEEREFSFLLPFPLSCHCNRTSIVSSVPSQIKREGMATP